ncbi:MAG TPA: hypothetical protein VK611_12630 [Acidimicrobiales bacterium]|nr:hypothetical protein [Acidimicrobiales bacterium]
MSPSKLRRAAALCGALLATATALVVAAPGADADPDLPIHQTITATTHLARLDQDLGAVGTFDGTFDAGTGEISGDLAFQASQTTLQLVGLPAAEVGAAIVPTGPAAGTIDLATSVVSLTSSFDVKILYVKPLGLGLNLVGDRCQTATPITLTSSGPIDLATQSGTLSGTFTFPPLKDCGLLTPALNLLVPGPGNTFTATAAPAAA